MRLVGHEESLREKRNTYKVLVGKRDGKRPLEGTALDGRVILKWTIKKYAGRV
jgi:hypothetical protein